jgi:hypothetical protein
VYIKEFIYQSIPLTIYLQSDEIKLVSFGMIDIEILCQSDRNFWVIVRYNSIQSSILVRVILKSHVVSSTKQKNHLSLSTMDVVKAD